MLPENERVFNCTLHDQEVRLVCHDVLQMSQLQRDYARVYGDFLLQFVFVNINEYWLHPVVSLIFMWCDLQIWCIGICRTASDSWIGMSC